MAIASVNDIIASAKQGIPFVKTAAVTSVIAMPFSVFNAAGNPGAGVLAGGQTTGSTTSGIVPDDTTPGYPLINAFGGGATGHLTKVDFASSVACRITIYDRLYVAGAFNFNAAAGAMSSQPSYAARLPNTDYGVCELWYEQVTLSTGIPSVAVTYTNGAGTTGRTTGTVVLGNPMAANRCWQLPLQAGDSGIQKVESVTATVASAGTFNIMVLRELWSGRVKMINDSDVHGPDKTDLVRVYDTSALYMLISSDTASTGVPDLKLRIGNL